jgi:hypothetical protein
VAQLFSLGGIRTTNKTHNTMKKQTISILLACAVALVFTGCATEHHSTAYDYKIIRGTIGGHSSSLPPLETQLDQAAADGWQVVTASGGDTDSAMIILKKHK